MKVLFFEPYALAIPHYETALELMQNHLDDGDQVSLFYCDANLYFCEANPNHDLLICANCISRRKMGLKLIEGKSKITQRVFEVLTNEEESFIKNWNVEFNSIEEIKQFTFENIDLGMAVASSLISAKRDANPDTKLHQELINKIFKSALKVYFSFKKTLLKQKPDIVYFFNGRFANIRVVLRLCEQYNIRFRIHERGASKDKYAVYHNHLPHSLTPFKKLVEEAWANETDSVVKENTANVYYHNRRNGTQQSWFSFVGDQKKDELPAQWDSSKRNIVIFNSSEDEFAAISGDFINPIFSNQLESIRYVVDSLKERNDVAIYLRMHPNLKEVKDNSTLALFKLRSSNFTLIPSDSEISTYKLIDESDVVLSFGSTTGIEATYWGKPSVLLGNTFYKFLNVTYNVEKKEDFIPFLLNVDVPKDKEGALKYAYYLATFGINFKHYKPKELFEGEFKGVRIRATPTLLKKIQNKIQSLLKSR